MKISKLFLALLVSYFFCFNVKSMEIIKLDEKNTITYLLNPPTRTLNNSTSFSTIPTQNTVTKSGSKFKPMKSKLPKKTTEQKQNKKRKTSSSMYGLTPKQEKELKKMCFHFMVNPFCFCCDNEKFKNIDALNQHLQSVHGET